MRLSCEARRGHTPPQVLAGGGGERAIVLRQRTRCQACPGGGVRQRPTLPHAPRTRRARGGTGEALRRRYPSRRRPRAHSSGSRAGDPCRRTPLPRMPMPIAIAISIPIVSPAHAHVHGGGKNDGSHSAGSRSPPHTTRYNAFAPLIPLLVQSRWPPGHGARGRVRPRVSSLAYARAVPTTVRGRGRQGPKRR